MLFQSASESIAYFSRSRSSEKIFSWFLQQSATNAAPTSELSGTRTPRSVIASSKLATRAVVGGGAMSSETLKPGIRLDLSIRALAVDGAPMSKPGTGLFMAEHDSIRQGPLASRQRAYG